MKLGGFSKQQKQAVVLYVSTLLGVLLGIFSSIINTRFLDPGDYGDVRYVQNILNFIASLLLFGYFLSGSRLLALSDKEDYSRRIRGAMCVILGIASAVLIVACALCGVFHTNKPDVAFLFYISLPVCLYPLLLNYVNTTAQGANHIGRLSNARLLPSLVYVPVAYLVYKYWGASSERMVLLQWGIYSFILFIIIISARTSFKDLKPIFASLNDENRNYGIQLYIGSLVMVATNYIAGITLGYFNEDNTEVGFYTLALTVTGPLSTLPAIIGTTYFKQFASQPKIPEKVMRFTILLTVISCLLFICIIKPLVVFLYSEDYSVVGAYASLLAIGFAIHGYGDMINRYLGSHGHGLSIRNASIANGIFKIFGYIVLVYYFNTMGAIVTTLLCDIIYTVVLMWYYRRFIKNE